MAVCQAFATRLLRGVRATPGRVGEALRYQRRFRIHRFFRLGRCRYRDAAAIYRVGTGHREFRRGYRSFKRLLVSLVSSKQATEFYKFGDGDFYFLRGEAVGSASPGARAISRRLSSTELEPFRSGSRDCEFMLSEIDKANQHRFFATFHRRPDFPAEYAYATVASRWLFPTFDGKIGLVGAAEKLNVIKELMSFEKYRKYLGVRHDFEYVSIPQRFACDDLDERLVSLEQQLRVAHASIFLVGIGHLKSGVLSHLRKFHPAVYLDVGSGIDALAGVIDISRPYFGGWRNFRLPSAGTYETIDFLQAKDENLTLLR